MKKVIFILIIFINLFGCSEIKSKFIEKKIKQSIQNDLTSKFKKYNLLVNKVELTGNDSYQGHAEILYDGNPYQVSVSVNGDNYQCKFDSYIIKEEAEIATKELINKDLKIEYKGLKLIATKVTLFPKTINEYEGKLTLKYTTLRNDEEEHEISINVKHSYDNGIIYKLPSDAFNFLISDYLLYYN